MRRVIAIAITGAALAGCSSFSLDSFKSAPPPVKIALESAPPGADATTSLGPACKTPCSIDVPAPDAGFSVTFAMPKFQPATVPVQVIRNPGDYASPPTTIIDPSPVFAELQPAAPPPKARKPMRPKKPQTAAAPATPPLPQRNPRAESGSALGSSVRLRIVAAVQRA